MITSTRGQITETHRTLSQTERLVRLPKFSRLAVAACTVNAPLAALLLLFGKLWSFASLLAGVTVSLMACGLLYYFVDKIMPLLVAGLRGQPYASAKNGAILQFIALVSGKFLVLGLVGYAILNFHLVNLFAVLIGFALTQTAVVVTVARQLKSC